MSGDKGGLGEQECHFGVYLGKGEWKARKKVRMRKGKRRRREKDLPLLQSFRVKISEKGKEEYIECKQVKRKKKKEKREKKKKKKKKKKNSLSL